MQNFKRIGGGPWKPSVDLTWNDPSCTNSDHDGRFMFRETLEEEKQFASMTANKANFGYVFERQCICEVPGQVPCPAWQPLPKEMTGKWRRKMRDEAN